MFAEVIMSINNQLLILFPANHASSDEESEDDDYVPDDDWKKVTYLGSSTKCLISNITGLLLANRVFSLSCSNML